MEKEWLSGTGVQLTNQWLSLLRTQLSCRHRVYNPRSSVQYHCRPESRSVQIISKNMFLSKLEDRRETLSRTCDATFVTKVVANSHSLKRHGTAGSL